MGNCCINVSKGTLDVDPETRKAFEREQQANSELKIIEHKKDILANNDENDLKQKGICSKFAEIKPKYGSIAYNGKNSLNPIPNVTDHAPLNDMERILEMKKTSSNRRKSKFCEEEAQNLPKITDITNKIGQQSNGSLRSLNNLGQPETKRFDSIINFNSQEKQIPQKINMKSMYKKVDTSQVSREKLE